MTWRYQIIEESEQGFFRLYEVFHEGKKKPLGYAETDIVGESVEDIKEILKMMTEDVAHYPVLKTSDFKKPKRKEKLASSGYAKKTTIDKYDAMDFKQPKKKK